MCKYKIYKLCCKLCIYTHTPPPVERLGYGERRFERLGNGERRIERLGYGERRIERLGYGERRYMLYYTKN